MAPSKKPFPVLTPEIVGDHLRHMPTEPAAFPPPKRRFSVTTDVLSYRRCKRQYGHFVRRGYVAAQSGQLFFGSVIHETLDRAHAHYKGERDAPAGSFPQDDDINFYFDEAVKALRAQGIRQMSATSRERARETILDFNRHEGERIYPRIVDAEHRLQKDKGSYVLYGVVDVIAKDAGAVSTSPSDWGDYEIWDYKGTGFPEDVQGLRDYEFQMRVYAHLYERRNGVRPKSALLWFLRAEVGHQVHTVDLSPTKVDEAVKAFDETVGAIGASIDSNDWDAITSEDAPDKETCDACDIRWDCPAKHLTYPVRVL